MALSEGQIVQCLVNAECIGTIKMSFESGPYNADRPTLNATKFARAIEAEVRKDYDALIRQLLEALESQCGVRDQEESAAITAARAGLERAAASEAMGSS